MRTSSILRSLFFVFAILACFCHFSNASDADDDEAEVIAPNEQILKSSDSGKVEAVNDITVSATFPNNPFKTVPAGETLELLVTFGNLNKTVDYTVKALTGFFTDPKNASLVLRNLTAYRYNNVVPANDKVNLTYPIMPDYEMLPQDVGLIVLIHYVDKTEQLYRAVGYNGVIKVAEPRTTFDLQDVGIYVMLVAFFVGVLYFVKQTLFPSAVVPARRKSRSASVSKSKAAASAAAASANSDAGYDEDWIPAHHLQSSQNQGKKSPKGGRKRK